jgi:FkbM family methyltransferase
MVPRCIESAKGGLTLALLCVVFALPSACSSEAPDASATSATQLFADATHPTATSVFGLCPPRRYRAHELNGAEVGIAKKIRGESLLVEEDESGFERWKTPYGTYWIVEGNIDTTCRLLAEQVVDIYRVHSSMGIRKGDIVLDCGAHFGVFVRNALDSGAELVVAIEVAPENIEALRRTFSAEITEGRVIVYPKGVWDKEDELILEREDQTWGHHVVEGEADDTRTRVPLTTIDKIVAELELPRVDFIKMDIEGAERKALAGATATLAEFRPRMAIASYHGADDLDVLPAVVLAAQPEYQMCLAGVGGGWGNLSLSFE